MQPGLLVRYALSAVIASGVHIGFVYVWVSVLGFTHAYLIGSGIGFALALSIAFLLQKYWTFRDASRERALSQFVSYGLVAASGLVLNIVLFAAVKILLEQWGHDFFGGWYLVAQTGVVCVVAVSNFLLNFFITFRHARLEER